jgi:type VI secretion system secreted protein Hcp
MKRLICVMTAVLGVSLAPGTFAALDIFLKLDGIRGESADELHKEWIDVLSFSWGLTTPTDSRSGRAVFGPLSYTQLLDAAVPATFLAAASAEVIKRVTLDLVRPGEDRTTFFQMDFNDVQITSLNMTGNVRSDRPEVAVKAMYQKVTMRYTPRDEKGKARPPIVASWDLKQDREAFSGDPAALMGLFEAGGSITDGHLSLTSPVPEPSTFVTMLAGLAAVLAVSLSRLRRSAT